MGDQWAEVDWRDDRVPISRRFDDPYYSLDNGLEETRHVFLDGNDLPQRFRDGFHIAELGFGTGLNLAASLMAWRDADVPGVLHYTTFEAFPLPKSDALKALAPFPEAKAILSPVLDALAEGQSQHSDDHLHFSLVTGDANETLSGWTGAADAWFLDGFSPAKNPELWSEGLMAEVGAHTNAGGTAATYTAAGHVQRALEAAGFDVARTPGFGRKRHMTIARRPA
ncbi:MAG: tRNA (5-methylaminomethyl-2-thiouridine)(34)-methyltransferase MnmD [Rhodobacteraceae bacterium]|nr:tRNA (5-methylaminomethyl-2-thiouridine)(34)-methyltransferase MnmD [Paracoccaceae bacterium]